jgi:signal transduction histidine kinase
VEAEAAPPVPPAVAHAVRRIANEAITNAIRHGGPTRIQIALDARRDALRLRVEDDGRGNGATAHTGHGLISVRRRARRLGGDATFGNGPSKGFVLEAWVRRDDRPTAEARDGAASARPQHE